MNRDICVGVTGLKIMNSPQSGFGVARSLKEAGYKVVGIDSSQLTSAICSPYFDHVYTLKSLDKEDINLFIKDLKRIKDETGLSVMIPNCDCEIYFFSRYENELKAIGINLLIPTLETLKQTSKLNLSNLNRCGLNIPTTVIASTENNLKTVTENLNFPIVCKGALADSYVAKDKVDLFIYFRKIDELLHGGRGNVIFQEFIKGDFYCTTGVSDRDHLLLRHFSMKKLGVDFKGSTWCGQTIQNKELEALTERFIEVTGWVGPFEMEFIKDSEGVFWLFEINPRCPAYIYFAAATGQNMPDSIVQIITAENEGDNKIKKDFSYDTDMVFTRLTDEVVYPKKDLNSLDPYGKVRNLQTRDKYCIKTKNSTDIKTFYELLNNGDADKVAVLYKSEAISYQELKERINERCNELKGIIKKNDKVIIRSDETPDTIIDIYAIDMLGAVIVPVSPLSTEKDIKLIVDDLKVNVMIYEQNIERINDKITAELPDDACMIFYTSGTTGKPKCIIHTKQSILTPCYGGGKAYGISDSDIIGGTPSLSFTYGFGAFAIMPFMFGATVSMYPYSLSLKNFMTVIRTIASHKITVFFSIPTAYKIIVNMPSQLDLYNLSSLKMLITAGEPMGLPLYEKLRQILPDTDILEHLGCTESFHGITLNYPENNRPGSIGKALPIYDVKVLDDKDNECQPMEKGRLTYKGTSGKYITQNESKEWKYTGDIAYKDEDGYFWFVSRYDDLIKTAGYLISPHEIESSILELPIVSEVVVIGVDDPFINQYIKAFIVLKPNPKIQDGLKDSIMESLKLQLPEYKIPAEIVFVDSIPKNKRGKVLRDELS